MVSDWIDVPLAAIDSADLFYQLSTRTDSADLALSIRAVGLLQPPILEPKEAAFRVVSGFRRIAACTRLNWTTTQARCLDPKTPPLLAARIAVSDNAFQRPLNVVEQARAYNLLLRASGKDADPLTAVQGTGLPGSRTALQRIRKIGQLPDFLQQAILAGTMAVPVALEISTWDREDARLLDRLFRQLTPNLNTQRELATHLVEIARRDGRSIAQILQQNVIVSVFADESASAPHKTKTFRKILKQMRYRALSEREDAFSQALKDLKLDPRIALQPPPYFEGPTYRLTLRVESRKELQNLLPVLHKLIQHPDLLPE